MAPKIFVTGATGYIGGTALEKIAAAHPDYEVTALVRSESKAQLLKAKFANIRTVQADLDSADVLEAESSKADIVLHCADCDHVVAAKALVAGLSKATKPVYLIHTSGAAILPNVNKPELLGTAPSADEKYGDISTLSTITSFPLEGHLHRDVDSVVLAAPDHVHTAIVCPPTIFGGGSSLQPRSNQIPELARLTMTTGAGFRVGDGKNCWNAVHVQDLAALFTLLAEAAAAGGKGADWDADGYYFAENELFCWGEAAAKIAGVAHGKGWIDTATVKALGEKEVAALHPFGPVLWGTNSVGTAERARKTLGWTPKEGKVFDAIPEAVALEAAKLGKS